MKKWAFRVMAAMVTLMVVGGARAVVVHDAVVPASWEVLSSNPQVASGSNEHLLVLGPPATSFSLAITPPPFNGTPPVFQFYGVVGNLTVPGLGETNVTVPTAPYAQEEYLVTLSAEGTPVSFLSMWITSPANVSLINNTLSEILLNLQVDGAILTTARENIASLESGQTLQWWTYVAGFIGFSCVVLYRERSLEVRSIWYRVWWRIHRVFNGRYRGYIKRGSGPIPDPLGIPPADRVYRAFYCQLCTLDYSEAGVRNHVAAAHPSVVGPAGPLLGKNYFADKESVAANARRRVDTDERGQRKAMRDRKVPTRIDLRDA